MAPSARPEVVSIVLNWNQRAFTLECIDSLRRAEPPPGGHSVLLVDNGSTDGTVEAVRSHQPEVEVIALPENLGFAAGANIGLRRALEARPDWMLLVNNDAVVSPDMLTRLLAAGGDADVGLVAPTIYYYTDPDRVWPSAGRRRRATLAAFDTSAHPPTRQPHDVDWAAACVLLVRRGVWESVGFLDERYFFYYEDHDLSLRARAAGWRIVHVPDASARHRVAGSSGYGSPRQRYLLARSSVPFYLEHTTGPHRVLIVIYRCGSLAKTLVRELVHLRLREAVAYLRGLRDGLWEYRASS